MNCSEYEISFVMISRRRLTVMITCIPNECTRTYLYLHFQDSSLSTHLQIEFVGRVVGEKEREKAYDGHENDWHKQVIQVEHWPPTEAQIHREAGLIRRALF